MNRSATAWANVRYQGLLPLAARRRSLGVFYARVVSLVEWTADERRRRVASDRIRRWLGLDALRAGLLYRRCLESEAREEADTSWFMAHPDDLERAYRGLARPDREGGSTIWLTLHLGSPILAYLYLCRVWRIDAQIIGRAIDGSNPMPLAKQSWGRRKVAWVEELSGKPFLGVDAISIARAREHLLGGGSLFAAVDVPGDVVGRSAKLEIFGESVRIAGGILRMAELAGVPMRSLIATARAQQIHVRCGDVLPAAARAAQLPRIGSEIEGILRASPQEWWLWPYLPAFGDDAAASR